jgi:hypothetical protein
MSFYEDSFKTVLQQKYEEVAEEAYDYDRRIRELDTRRINSYGLIAHTEVIEGEHWIPDRSCACGACNWARKHKENGLFKPHDNSRIDRPIPESQLSIGRKLEKEIDLAHHQASNANRGYDREEDEAYERNAGPFPEWTPKVLRLAEFADRNGLDGFGNYWKNRTRFMDSGTIADLEDMLNDVGLAYPDLDDVLAGHPPATRKSIKAMIASPTWADICLLSMVPLLLIAFVACISVFG